MQFRIRSGERFRERFSKCFSERFSKRSSKSLHVHFIIFGVDTGVMLLSFS